MAVTNRSATRALNLYSRLQKSPYKFDFYRTMRLLECVHPDFPRIGEALRPGKDPVRFSQTPSTIFAPSEIDSFTPAKDGKKPRLGMLHFGLFGPNGPLPLHLTEYAKDRLNNSDDATFSAFADLFRGSLHSSLQHGSKILFEGYLIDHCQHSRTAAPGEFDAPGVFGADQSPLPGFHGKTDHASR